MTTLKERSTTTTTNDDVESALSSRQQLPPPTVAPSDPAADSPEELIRSLTNAVDCIRYVVIAGLVIATVFAGVATYEVLSRLEHEAFNSNFKDLASRLTQSFLYDLSYKMWQAYSLSIAMTGMNVLDSSVPFLKEKFMAAASSSNAKRVVYSPLLRGQKQRLEWESFAKTSLASNAEQSNQLVCHVCKDTAHAVASPENTLHIPSFPTMTCGNLETWGLQGVIPPSFCSSAQFVAEQSCNCQAISQQPAATNGAGGQNSTSNKVSESIFQMDGNGTIVTNETGVGIYSPVWQVANFAPPSAFLYDQLSDPVRRQAIISAAKHKLATFSETKFYLGEYEDLMQQTLQANSPIFSVFYPIFNAVGADKVIGTMALDFDWQFLFTGALPFGSDGIILVIENSHGQIFTFRIADNQLVFVGQGDHHDSTFDDVEQGCDFQSFNQLRLLASPIELSQTNTTTDDLCSYKVHVYPSRDYKSRYVTRKPIFYTSVVVLIFVSTSTVFFLYDFLVRRRQTKVLRSAVANSTIVSSLFPANVRERLIESSQHHSRITSKRGKPESPEAMGIPAQNPRLQLTNYLARPAGGQATEFLENEPIADLFPHTTVFFADIAGFTAWSSEREPSHVFKLLETVYSSFDAIAAKLGVFKVETVGDCYVAVTGLPNPQENHAVIMAMFAQRCLSSMNRLTKQLESILGPSTADLAIRVGIHSGPVIAGVLRGTMSRFQLFGDTMNTASRMESNGVVNRIQISQATAALLQEAGKADWITPRTDNVLFKGKGMMQTFWLTQAEVINDGDVDLTSPPGVVVGRTDVLSGVINLHSKDSFGSLDQLINWNVDLLYKQLQKIEAGRRAITSRSRRAHNSKCNSEAALSSRLFEEGCHPRDEVVESFSMPEFSATAAKNRVEPTSVELPEQVVEQLLGYVTRIAALYDGSNGFHNLEHASHVAMSCAKLMKRIIAPDGVDYQQRSTAKNQRIQAVAKEIHDTTFGISSDPLMQFAAVFAALIHDVDHEGVPNVQLSKESSPKAALYQNRSVAEQHSVQIAWQILMEDKFRDLRFCICRTEAEMLRFRQFVVNAVIATDISDASLRKWREDRWTHAFSTPDDDPESAHRKASIVYDYILQASDVAHTMQHWHTYRKWNKRLFDERYHAFRQGRADQDPSIKWYEEELGFFDFYVIPLARKLEECGVFGVSSDEYLSHAIENRHEWALKGKDIVQEMLSSYQDNSG